MHARHDKPEPNLQYAVIREERVGNADNFRKPSTSRHPAVTWRD
jgi:hypothetical protein